jgi:hypothetical protein
VGVLSQPRLIGSKPVRDNNQCRRVVLVNTDVSEESIAYIIRVERMGALESDISFRFEIPRITSLISNASITDRHSFVRILSHVVRAHIALLCSCQ